MAEIIPAEPDPNAGPVRAWLDGTPPIAENLEEIRRQLRSLDNEIVDALYRRKRLTIGATLFKAVAGEVLAPEQQAKVNDGVVAHAEELDPDDKDFHELVRTTYEELVPKYVALQAEAFDRTELL